MKGKILIFAAVSAMSCACSNQVDELGTGNHELSNSQNDSALKIATYIANNETSRSQDGFESKTTFKSGDQMGLFLYKGTWGTAYTGISIQNNKSTCNGSAWEQENPYYLNADDAHVWAYYPYSSTVTDGKKIPVSIEGSSANTDYMYGRTEQTVSVLNTVAEIPMKHAMSQFVIRMKPSPDYHDAGSTPGVLSNVTIKTKSGSSTLYKSGELDITTGTITGKTNSNAISWSPQIQLEANENHDYSAIILPRTVAQGELVVQLTVDNANYTFDLPAIEWQKGYRYIYAFELKSNDVVIGGEDGSDITIEDWKDQTSDVELVPAK